jgi:hypothetical protein
LLLNVALDDRNNNNTGTTDSSSFVQSRPDDDDDKSRALLVQIPAGLVLLCMLMKLGDYVRYHWQRRRQVVSNHSVGTTTIHDADRIVVELDEGPVSQMAGLWGL